MKNIFVTVLLMLACGSATTEPKQTKDKPRIVVDPVEQTDFVCQDSNGETLTCTTNDDCCSGFECSYDPEKSRHTKYCLR